MVVHMVSTVDNPFNPWTQFDEWYAWDEAHGYCSCGLLERISRSSNELAPVDIHNAIQHAIDEITTENVSGMHTKVKRGDGPVAKG